MKWEAVVCGAAWCHTHDPMGSRGGSCLLMVLTTSTPRGVGLRLRPHRTMMGSSALEPASLVFRSKQGRETIPATPEPIPKVVLKVPFLQSWPGAEL